MKEIFCKIYEFPSQIPVKRRMEIIEKHLGEGLSFREIGRLFGVSGEAIRYHWKRFKLGIYKRSEREK
ncbi:MAG: hypothetical protein ACUZ8H_05390 [Candidatus Anammoxibacter sp.]